MPFEVRTFPEVPGTTTADRSAADWETTTEPVVGLTVTVPSEFETEETAPEPPPPRGSIRR